MIILECEICGAGGASKKAQVGESELVVCDDCASLGEVEGVVEKSPDKKIQSKKSSQKTSGIRESDQRVLKRDFGSAVREARESEEMKMEELAEAISEKRSVVRRVENSELKPDRKLSKKLKRELDVELYTELEEGDAPGGSDDESLTIGDVAKVK